MSRHQECLIEALKSLGHQSTVELMGLMGSRQLVPHYAETRQSRKFGESLKSYVFYLFLCECSEHYSSGKY